MIIWVSGPQFAVVKKKLNVIRIKCTCGDASHNNRFALFQPRNVLSLTYIDAGLHDRCYGYLYHCRQMRVKRDICNRSPRMNE
jgi:hypothetical protein